MQSSDPQGSARDWAAMSEHQTVQVIGVDRPTLGRDLKAVEHKDFVVIDGAPRRHELTLSAIKVADLVLIPVQPSPYDIWATSDLVDLVTQRIELTEGRLQAAFVVSRVIRGTRLGREVIEALGEYSLPVLEARINQRVIYPGSAGQGSTVVDQAPASEAAIEIHTLTQEGMQLLKPGQSADQPFPVASRPIGCSLIEQRLALDPGKRLKAGFGPHFGMAGASWSGGVHGLDVTVG